MKKAAQDKAAGAGTGERRRSSVTTEKVKLNSGHYIPQVALGVYKAPNDGTTENAVKWAFEAGYRHVDSGKHQVSLFPEHCCTARSLYFVSCADFGCFYFSLSQFLQFAQLPAT